MASSTNRAPKGTPTARSNADSLRWMAGLFLLFVGLFLTAAVFFYFFDWRVDMSLFTNIDHPLHDGGVENPCGPIGARFGQWCVGDAFGLFGIILPLVLTILGVRIIRQRPLLLNHSVLGALLVLLLGSLTLGFAFDERFALFGSGWGGAYGIEIARLLVGAIGGVGTTILLVVGWIATGVFINRNFINTVNRAGNAVVDRGEKIAEIVKQSVVHNADAKESFESEEPFVPAESEPVMPPEPPAVEPAPLFEEVTVTAAPVAVAIERPAEQPAEAWTEPDPEEPQSDEGAETSWLSGEESPFSEVSVTGEPLQPAVSMRTSRETMGISRRVMSEEDAFTEVDLSDGTVSRSVTSEPQRPDLRPRTIVGGSPFTTVDLNPAAPAVPELSAAPKEGGVVVTVEEHEDRVADERQIEKNLYDPMKDLNNYQRPPVQLLEDYSSDSEVSDEEIYENKSKIEETLKNFGIPIQRIKATVGPTVTLYEIVQAQGVKISKIQGLENDIAQSLKALGIRIIAPIPGKGTIGIEVPNRDKQVVSMYSAIRSLRFQESKAELPVVIGRTIQNENYVFDLAKMPHLLVAGATGQGKSVGLNAIITSLLYRKHPSQLKFVMIDPKMVEFSLYAKIERHFLAKMESEEEAIVTDPRKAVYTLNALCSEMDTRLELCKRAGARNIAEYNAKFTARKLNPQKGHRYLPYIVVVVDEFADLIMTAREVEGPVMRLAQKARAIGIHLIIATQRPDVKVITGGIKANFPARIAFRVMQMIDSRTIIDQPGANQLIGRGDMLFSKDGELTRIQCALVETSEVERIVDFIAAQQGYPDAYPLPDYTPEGGEGGPGMGSEESLAPVKYDSLFAEIAREAVSSGQISVSMIQRNYEVGFNRAGRIMMQLERAGIVGRQQGAKPRDILFHDMPSLEAKLQDLGVF